MIDDLFPNHNLLNPLVNRVIFYSGSTGRTEWDLFLICLEINYKLDFCLYFTKVLCKKKSDSFLDNENKSYLTDLCRSSDLWKLLSLLEIEFLQKENLPLFHSVIILQC